MRTLRHGLVIVPLAVLGALLLACEADRSPVVEPPVAIEEAPAEAPAPAAEGEIARSDFETGDTGEWSATEPAPGEPASKAEGDGAGAEDE